MSRVQSALLPNPIADVATFNTIVQSVITDNPFGCVAYMTAGQDHPAVEKTKESYTAKIVYQDNDAKICGTGTHGSHHSPGIIPAQQPSLPLRPSRTAHGGMPAHDFESDAFAATLKCHDPSGEIYMVNFTRDRVSLTSYSDDAIRAKVETWADGVAALA